MELSLAGNCKRRNQSSQDARRENNRENKSNRKPFNFHRSCLQCGFDSSSSFQFSDSSRQVLYSRIKEAVRSELRFDIVQATLNLFQLLRWKGSSNSPGYVSLFPQRDS